MTGSQREAINLLMMMESVTVNADLIAQALGMNPGVLRKRVQDGNYLLSLYDYNRETGRIRFFRKSFLQAIGEMPEDSPERTVVQAMDDLREELHELRLILMAQLSIGPLLRLDELKQKEAAASGN